MKPISRKVLGAAAAGAIAIAVPLVASWEGLYTRAYPDRLAYNIPTVCHGETEGVKLGDVYSPQQCADMLAAKLPRYNDEISRCIKVQISDKTRAALISFAYNVGSDGFCRSSALRMLNAGNGRGACEALMLWNRAGGKYVQGLANRRAAERKLCLEGLT